VRQQQVHRLHGGQLLQMQAMQVQQRQVVEQCGCYQAVRSGRLPT
jgi:hypothetical protein